VREGTTAGCRLPLFTAVTADGSQEIRLAEEANEGLSLAGLPSALMKLVMIALLTFQFNRIQECKTVLLDHFVRRDIMWQGNRVKFYSISIFEQILA
jgi:hypothetical protein